MSRAAGIAAAAAVAAVLALAALAPGAVRAGREHARAAPDFPTEDPARWINSPPLTMAGLKGKVVLIDVWTFG